MEMELKAMDPTQVDPTTMTAEGLENAIKKQLELVAQIDLLVLENHSVMEKIVRVTVP